MEERLKVEVQISSYDAKGLQCFVAEQLVLCGLSLWTTKNTKHETFCGLENLLILI